LHPGSKQFLDEQRISAMATHYQANIPDLSAEIHTAKRLLDRKKTAAIASDTESGAMNNTLYMQFLRLLEPYRDALYELYRLLVIACTLPATSAGSERSFSKLKLIKTYLCNRMDDG
jgi:hAT family C-terminal dimerisation region